MTSLGAKRLRISNRQRRADQSHNGGWFGRRPSYPLHCIGALVNVENAIEQLHEPEQVVEKRVTVCSSQLLKPTAYLIPVNSLWDSAFS